LKDEKILVGIFDPMVANYAQIVDARNSFMDATLDQCKDLWNDVDEWIIANLTNEFLGEKKLKGGKSLEEVGKELVKRIQETIEAKGLVKTGKMRDSITMRKVKK
jgi:hypothetical protein